MNNQLPEDADPVKYDVTQFERCEDCAIPPTGTGIRTVYIIEGEYILCEECLKHHGYTVYKGEVFSE